MKKGDVVGNFELVKRVDSFLDLYLILIKQKSIYWKHRMFPVAFFLHWSVAMLEQSVKAGNFWVAKRVGTKKVVP